MPISAQSRAAGFLRTLFRLGLIVGFALLVNLGLNWLQVHFESVPTPGARLMVTGIVILSLFLYAVLLAIPFVPGVEIGLSLLMMQGPKIAPFVFVATLLGLAMAYFAGRHMPYGVMQNLFADAGLKSASGLLDRLKPLNQKQRLDLLQAKLPAWLGRRLIRYRYLSIALALNIPGNAFIGGGGGIALVAGISRLFNTGTILICFALAVAPVPLLVWFFGIDVLAWLK